jgi:hypothetical protein
MLLNNNMQSQSPNQEPIAAKALALAQRKLQVVFGSALDVEAPECTCTEATICSFCAWAENQIHEDNERI